MMEWRNARDKFSKGDVVPAGDALRRGIAHRGDIGTVVGFGHTASVVRVARVLGVMPDDLRPQLQRLDARGVVRLIPAAYEPGQQRERPVWSERVKLRGGAS